MGHAGRSKDSGAIAAMLKSLKIHCTNLTDRLCRAGPLRRIGRRFARQEDGAAAIEFAMVAAPFLGLLLAIMETAFVLYAGQVLETAVADSARLIMTGQAQTAGWDAATFKQQVCNRVAGLFNCSSGVWVDVQTYTTFSGAGGNANAQGALDGQGKLQTANFKYQPGNPGDIVVVRLMYQWPVYVSLLGLNLSDTTGSKRLLMSTVAFRNEPYM
jgi:Flp pilus assembly protein TadG